MFKSLKPYTFGMECEVNGGVRRQSFQHDKFDWLNFSNNEGSVIREYITTPCGGREFLKRSCVLGHMLGFEHARGSGDARAESFHLHMGYRQRMANAREYNQPSIHVRQLNQAAPLLVAAHHLSRTGVQYRNMVSDCERIHQNTETLTGRASWMSRNGLGTMELRMNENPAPLVPVMLYPTIKDTRFTASVEGCSTVHQRPATTSAMVRESMGSMYDGMIKAAKEYWDYPVVNQCLDAFSEGATHVETWEIASRFFGAIPRGRYNQMMSKLES